MLFRKFRLWLLHQGKFTNAIIDSIPYALPWINVPVNHPGYKQLESKGIEIISDKPFRNQIISYYESSTNWLEFSIHKYEEDFESINDFWLTEDYYADNVKRFLSLMPLNGKKLKQDPKLMGLIYKQYSFTQPMKWQTVGGMERIIKMIS